MCSIVMMKIAVVFCFCEVINAAAVMGKQDTEHRCGIVASPNPIHQHPWLVLLEFYRRDMKHERRCGGSLISKRHVVTAAHCVQKAISKNARLFARLGEYDLSKEVDCVDGVCADLPVKLEVVQVTTHEDYKNHDIAILTLSDDAPYTDTIRPICFPSAEDLRERMVFSASGWGEIVNKGVYSDVKKDLRLPYWARSNCQSAYNSKVPSHVICAGGEQGIDTCRGDSGGPLVWGKNYFELFGVTSSGSVNCGTKGTPGIYTSVIDHLDWIKEVINQ
ncbi:unnamed protein product [Chilo suppressalis]|uniref:Peptidase S1 domain-containing protein n=1 Tax=Chilo suppressalis TaxID=168631 RepID=A0ABN8B2W0_CHISP|nr:unnamed protein product [Chilo suppressalis]